MEKEPGFRELRAELETLRRLLYQSNSQHGKAMYHRRARGALRCLERGLGEVDDKNESMVAGKDFRRAVRLLRQAADGYTALLRRGFFVAVASIKLACLAKILALVERLPNVYKLGMDVSDTTFHSNLHFNGLLADMGQVIPRNSLSATEHVGGRQKRKQEINAESHRSKKRSKKVDDTNIKEKSQMASSRPAKHLERIQPTEKRGDKSPRQTAQTTNGAPKMSKKKEKKKKNAKQHKKDKVKKDDIDDIFGLF